MLASLRAARRRREILSFALGRRETLRKAYGDCNDQPETPLDLHFSLLMSATPATITTSSIVVEAMALVPPAPLRPVGYSTPVTGPWRARSGNPGGRYTVGGHPATA